ncbi:MAG: DUF1801 domain-containing protein [Bacteroidetes bacterium]|nr:DUF1801 domain-containing protein [Bacteroidota bacterium]
MRDIDNYFFQKAEPVKSCLLFLRDHILGFDQNITEAWKYHMPFYCYDGKMFCYLWTGKDNGQPHIGIVEGRKISHPLLIQGSRARMKILFIDPNSDIPLDTIIEVLLAALSLYQ